MAGPDNQRNQQLVIPAGESEISYTSRALTQKIINFEFTVKRTLATTIGPTIYEPDRPATADPATVFGTMHGIFHTTLLGGQADMLLVRSGTKLFRHAGWQRGWEELYTGLTSDTRGGSFPDQFVVINDKIIYTNGVNNALIIDAHGSVFPLGFSQRPSPPSIFGPAQFSDKTIYYPNAGGYSWRGDIGTPGDALNGTQGAVLDGSWFYYAQYEDSFGNLSQPSVASNVAAVRTVQANPTVPGDGETQTGATIDDLTRQFLIRLTGLGPPHTVATNIYRTPDTRRAGTIPQFLARVPGRELSVMGDRRSDSDLADPMQKTTGVPVFRMMCVHNGSLVIANTPNDPGIVRMSDPGFPGTFLESQFIYPDSGGAEVTAVASHMGRLLAYTEMAVYDITPDRTTGGLTNAITLAQGIGCSSPRSIAPLADGRLVWLSRDGFYSCDPNGRIKRISDDIHKTLFYDMNTSRYRRAVSALDPISREYHCVVAPAGEADNRITFCYDGQNWRRHDFEQITIADICTTDDYRQLVIFAGTDKSGASPYPNVFVKDHETTNYTVPARKALYRSGWFFADTTGSTPIHLRSIYLGMIDAFDEKFTIRFFRNNSWKPILEMTDVLAIGVDDDSDVVRDVAGEAVIGTARAHEPRLFWRMIPVGLENAYSWAFEIEVNYPTRINIASISYDQSVATGGNIRGRVPLRADV
jgi:hypothetical protein